LWVCDYSHWHRYLNGGDWRLYGSLIPSVLFGHTRACRRKAAVHRLAVRTDGPGLPIPPADGSANGPLAHTWCGGRSPA